MVLVKERMDVQTEGMIIYAGLRTFLQDKRSKGRKLNIEEDIESCEILVVEIQRPDVQSRCANKLTKERI